MRKITKEAVIKLLEKNTDGLTIQEISKLLKMSRNTISVALAHLEGASLIRVRQVGMAKLHYWKGNSS